MSRFVQVFAVILPLLTVVEQAFGFTLNGPKPPWQTPRLGYPAPAIDGPMNLNEEYRWNIPTIHYGYSAGFLSYFGQDGVDAIEEAVEIVNDLPALDGVDLNDYQTDSGRMNLRAQALGLRDIKSTALSLLLDARGVRDATEYVFALRNKNVIDATTALVNPYIVVHRNFDPFTLRPTPYVNGTLYTYTLIESLPVTDLTTIVNFPVDPLERLIPRTLPVSGNRIIPPGFFWTQLTRDDVGALKHIYRSSNFNPENSLGDVTTGAAAAAGGAAGAGAANPAVGFPGGGGVFDFPGANTGVGGGVFDFPFNTLTNTGIQGPVAGVGGAVGGAFQNATVPAAVRAGIDHINMVRADYDGLLGVFFEPISLRYSETILTNNRPSSRSLTRNVTAPDIIFDGADLQGGDGTPGIVVYAVNVVGAGPGTGPAGGAGGGAANPGAQNPGGQGVQAGFSNSDALDGLTGDDFGPGVIFPPYRIVFNTVGPPLQNASPSFLTEESAIQLPTWGVFDGTTNDPIVFPTGTSILDLERQVSR